MKTKTKNVQDNRKKTERKKKKEKKLEHCWTQHIKKKKERIDIFSKIDSTSLHRLKKKEEKKTEHFWTVIVTLFWLVVKWKFLILFEFKGDIRIFFPVHIMKFDENY